MSPRGQWSSVGACAGGGREDGEGACPTSVLSGKGINRGVGAGQGAGVEITRPIVCGRGPASRQDG